MSRSQVFSGERRKNDLLHAPRPCGSHRAAHQRVRGTDLVVPIGADHQQPLHIRLGQQVVEQVECRRVEPLQIVEEERQWMFRPRETPRNRRNTS